MKKILLYSIVSVSLFASCNSKNNSDKDTTEISINKPTPPKAEGPVRVLFIGNSHTEYFASFPEVLKAFCKENGKEAEIFTLIKMGAGIDEILEDNKTEADRIFSQTDKDGNYFDYLIIQESTPIVLTEEDVFMKDAKKIHGLAIKNSPGVASYIYQLTSPFDYGTADFKDYQEVINKNVIAVSKSLPNTGILNFANVLASAYDGKENYLAKTDNIDKLRHNDNSHHMLNDAVFLNSIVLYQQLFGETPKIPKQLPLSTGTDDDDEIKLMDVSQGVSNPESLIKIAKSYQ